MCNGQGIPEGTCNCEGTEYIPEGDCDCFGNQLDVFGVCGGGCVADIDADGICDVVDECVGNYDACGVCNGPGEIYECGCANIPPLDCDCEGNQLDLLGVCGGDCLDDEDEDGICDSVDDCVGTYDTCGISNGPGEIYECGCAGIPDGQCDCNGTLPNACGSCDENLDVSVNYTTPLDIPDTGIELNVELEVEQFEEGQTLESCADLNSVTVNLEHSFIGDLSFSITCPNGTQVLLMDNGASGTPDPTGCTPEDLGGNDLGLVDVAGADYSWSMNAEWVLDDANNPSVRTRCLQVCICPAAICAIWKVAH